MSCNCENNTEIISPEKVKKIQEILGTDEVIIVATKGDFLEMKINARGAVVKTVAIELLDYIKSESKLNFNLVMSMFL